MKEAIDKHTGRTWIQLNEDELKFGFLSQCIEAVASAEGRDYVETFDRLEKANMTEGYILAHYGVLHTESMENIVLELQKLLHQRESGKHA